MVFICIFVIINEMAYFHMLIGHLNFLFRRKLSAHLVPSSPIPTADCPLLKHSHCMLAIPWDVFFPSRLSQWFIPTRFQHMSPEVGRGHEHEAKDSPAPRSAQSEHSYHPCPFTSHCHFHFSFLQSSLYPGAQLPFSFCSNKKTNLRGNAIDAGY